MYTEFFGFRERPFEITPDPKFLYLTEGSREVLSTLAYGIKERRGFIAMIGEVGSGKTLMLNTVQSWLDNRTKFATIFNSDLTFKQLLMYALCDLEIISVNKKLTKAEAIQHLNNYALEQLEGDGNLVLFIDEAQNLPIRVLENIRMLGNLETQKQKLVQIVMAGQPEFDKKLALPECRQLSQRIGLKVYAEQFGSKDTFEYIQHRLDVAGYNGPVLFSERALQAIFDNSKGSPRKINLLCDNALLQGYGKNLKQIEESIILDVEKSLIGSAEPDPEFLSWTEKEIATMQFGSWLKKTENNKKGLKRIFYILVLIIIFFFLIYSAITEFNLDLNFPKI